LPVVDLPLSRMERIPVIDVSPIGLTSISPTFDDYQQVSSSLAQALSTWGFAYLTNHGLNPTTITSCFSQSEAFFKLPQTIKDKFARGIETIQGYSSQGREILEETIEAKESFDVSKIAPSGVLPDAEVPKLRPSITELSREAGSLAQRLLRCLALDLQIDIEKFLHAHSGMLTGVANASAIRLLHYPPLDIDEQNLAQQKITRCGKHTDYGGLTLIFQDSLGGLEVQTLDGTEWAKAPPLDGAIVVNIGDLLQFWSGGKYRATPHRVIVDAEMCNQARYSIAVFIHPNHDTDISPFGGKSKIEEGDHKRTAKVHINKRFAETYLT